MFFLLRRPLLGAIHFGFLPFECQRDDFFPPAANQSPTKAHLLQEKGINVAFDDRESIQSKSETRATTNDNHEILGKSITIHYPFVLIKTRRFFQVVLFAVLAAAMAMPSLIGGYGGAVVGGYGGVIGGYGYPLAAPRPLVQHYNGAVVPLDEPAVIAARADHLRAKAAQAHVW